MTANIIAVYYESVATALVLSAGGMYAAWEIGVWKALAPHFRPDLIVGASAGAWNGWAIAGGATPEELEREWLDSTLTGVRVLRAEPMHRWARHLWARFRPQMPFGLVVVDTPRFRESLVRGGDVTWRHLAATASIPGLFPPVRIDGHLYMDGGLLDVLPLWAAQEMGATRAIAINCLKGLPSRFLRRVLRRPSPALKLEVVSIVPSEPLGSLRDSIVWSRTKIERRIELGERDGKQALSSITIGTKSGPGA
jgi:predicted acylesterase/phospholipase RssA